MLLRAENLTYIYGHGTPWEVKALAGVNLTISEGDVIGIIGPTGCGKSTLAQQLAGLIQPTSGRVYFRGGDLARGDVNQNLRREVGIVFQHPENGLFERTVYNDVAFAARNLGLAENEVNRRVKDALSLVGLDLEDYRDRSPFELSGGEARRVAIAGVLVMNPSILLLDEPTIGLDPRGRRIVFTMIRELRDRKGVAIVLVSHSMEEIAVFANRVAVMNRGRVVMAGSPRQIFSRRGELEEIGLRPPVVIQLMDRLREHYPGICTDVLTLDEARDEILKTVKWL